MLEMMVNRCDCCEIGRELAATATKRRDVLLSKEDSPQGASLVNLSSGYFDSNARYVNLNNGNVNNNSKNNNYNVRAFLRVLALRGQIKDTLQPHLHPSKSTRQ